jgi:hypothetical protein
VRGVLFTADALHAQKKLGSYSVCCWELDCR